MFKIAPRKRARLRKHESLTIESLEARQLMTGSMALDTDSGVRIDSKATANAAFVHSTTTTQGVGQSSMASLYFAPREKTTFGGWIQFSGGVVSVYGTNVGDTVNVRYHGGWGTNAPYLHVTLSNSARTQAEVYFLPTVSKVEFFGYGGNDVFRNGTHIASYAEGGRGNDELIGGSTADVLSGGTGSDELRGNSGVDTLYGGPGNDDIWGGRHGDILAGESGIDTLHGGQGVDTLSGGLQDDTLFGEEGVDYLYGDSGDDELYGGLDNDHLYGGPGLDGLYGGYGFDYLKGGSGADRLLTHDSGEGIVMDEIDQLMAEDAVLRFVAGSHTDDADFSTGVGVGVPWTEIEVIEVDRALRVLHDRTEDTKLLKTHSGHEITFARRQSHERFVGLNSGPSDAKVIYFYDNSFGTEDRVHHVTIHEIAHNWDEQDENGIIDVFRSYSSWTKDPGDVGFVEASGGWYFGPSIISNSAYLGWNFASDYAQTNPVEDFAESFSAVFMSELGLEMITEDAVGIVAIPQKAQLIRSWLNSL